VTWLRRLGAGIALLIFGVALGAAGIAVHANRSIVAGHELPWGLVLTLLALAAGVRGAVWWARSRVAGFVVAAGWIVATLVLAQENAAGTILLPDDLRSQVYLFGGVALVALASLVPLPSQEPERPRGAHAAGPTAPGPTALGRTAPDPTAQARSPVAGEPPHPSAPQ
jgi:hypothetical protein